MCTPLQSAMDDAIQELKDGYLQDLAAAGFPADDQVEALVTRMACTWLGLMFLYRAGGYDNMPDQTGLMCEPIHRAFVEGWITGIGDRVAEALDAASDEDPEAEEQA